MINFPNNPQIDDVFRVNGYTYYWDGNSWTNIYNPIIIPSFVSQINTELGVNIVSNGILLQQAYTITISGGEYQIASNSNFSTIVQNWTTGSFSVAPGQYVRVRHTSSSSWSTNTVTTVNFGSNVRTFTSSTRAQQVILLTTVGTGTWTVPANFPAVNKVEVIGGGGNGSLFAQPPGTRQGGGGGGGGGYAIKNNLALTPSSSVNYKVGAATEDTWFVDASTVRATGGTTAALRSFGLGGTGTAGDLTRDGGNGGTGGIASSGGCIGSSGSGGGAGGPNANGGTGGDGSAGIGFSPSCTATPLPSVGLGGGLPAGNGGQGTYNLATGKEGNNYGGGGAGAASAASPGNLVGLGAQGVIRITY